MHKLNLPSLAKKAKGAIEKHGPEILTGIGIAGMITTTVTAVRATPKALYLIEQRKYELLEAGQIQSMEDSVLSNREIIRVAWKCYIPSAITAVLSMSCLIGASSVNLKRNAALATAYKLSEAALIEYRDAVVETLGEKKDHLIKDKMAEKKLENDPVTKKEIIITERGNTLCYDAISGRYFKSDMETIKRAQNIINREMLSQNYVSLNEFYDELNLEHTTQGDNLGWRIEDGIVDIDFSSRIAVNGDPCLVIDYSIAPKYDYWKFA